MLRGSSYIHDPAGARIRSRSPKGARSLVIARTPARADPDLRMPRD